MLLSRPRSCSTYKSRQLARHFSSSCLPSVHEIFTSKHVEPDGRVLQFASVTVKNLKKGESALSAWQYACSLVGATPPTVAVAFVSRLTDSTLSAIRQFAQQFSQSAPKQEGRNPAACWITKSKPTPSPPFIGCVISPNYEKLALTNMGEYFLWGDAHGEGGDGHNGSGVGDSVDQQNVKRAGISDCSPVAVDSSVFSSTCMHAAVTNKDDEGTYSDWEELIKECDHSQIECEAQKDGHDNGKNEVDFILVHELPGQDNTKERLASFWNQFTQAPHKPKVEKILDLSDIFLRSDCDNVIILSNASRKHSDMPQLRESLTKDNSRDGKCPSKQRDHGTKSFSSAFENFPSKRERYEKETKCEDEACCLTLCVGHMPGVKAMGFHTRTTALPWLPDLADAVTINNPHMLLLSAPGFDIAEFCQRLGCMFPNGYRAGASLLAMHNREEKVDDPSIFCGLKVESVGAVGISIISSEGARVSIDAFSEFVRVSLGMLPGSSWCMFFEECVRRSLFLPGTAKIDWLETFQKTWKTNPDSVLAILEKKLNDTHRYQCSSEKLHTANVYGQSKEKEKQEALPIVAVDHVLFPGFFIPLYIEYPCDMLMVKECIERGKPFGVSTMCSKIPSDPIDCKDIVGTVADMRVTLYGNDCKSCIVAQGVRRFRVIDRRVNIKPATFGQLVGQVEFIDDIELNNESDKAEVRELARRALDLCQQLFPSAFALLSPKKICLDPLTTSFAIGHILPVSAEVKRRWLSMVNTKYRLKEQITFLHA